MVTEIYWEVVLAMQQQPQCLKITKKVAHLNFHAKNIICKLRLFKGFSNTVRQGCTEALLDF